MSYFTRRHSRFGLVIAIGNGINILAIKISYVLMFGNFKFNPNEMWVSSLPTCWTEIHGCELSFMVNWNSWVWIVIYVFRWVFKSSLVIANEDMHWMYISFIEHNVKLCVPCASYACESAVLVCTKRVDCMLKVYKVYLGRSIQLLFSLSFFSMQAEQNWWLIKSKWI